METTASGWRKREKVDPYHGPMSIYEVHLGSWSRIPEEDDRFLTYREFADRLVDHASGLGFTHIELMPISEFPLRRFVGLPGGELFLLQRVVLEIRTIFATLWIGAIRRALGSFSIGCRRTFRRMHTGWGVSTERLSMSMPIPARVSTGIGETLVFNFWTK